MNFDEAKATFLSESKELLEEMETLLIELEQSPKDEERINALFRAIHTIKGSGGVFGFSRLEGFTHQVETLLDRVRDGEITLDSRTVGVLLRSRDHISRLVDAELDGTELDPATRQEDAVLLSELGAILSGQSAGEAQGAFDEASRVGWLATIRFGRDVLRNGLDPAALLRYLGQTGLLVASKAYFSTPSEPNEFQPTDCHVELDLVIDGAASQEEIDNAFEFFREDCELNIAPPNPSEETVRSLFADRTPEEIAERLSQLGVDWPPAVPGATAPAESAPSGESPSTNGITARSGTNRTLRIDAEKLDRLINLVGELVIAGASTDLIAQRLNDETLLEANSMVNRLVEEIRDTALRLRMVQIGETFSRFHRVVRDVSKELGKEIRLVVAGGETELDKTVVEKIGDPLMHLVRNAMDHGIETAEERRKSGKPVPGTVTLNAYHDSGSIVIEVSDDGRGLNLERILEKARANGVVAANQQLTDQEIARLIFEPGLSTAQSVSNLSGRGVGMDVVKRNIESLRGTVDVETAAGEGTKAVIRLPLTLAIIDGFLVRVGQSAYVIPLDMVLECIEMADAERSSGKAGSHYINLRGEVLPYLTLHDLFEEEAPPQERENIVVVHHGGQKAGLVVDTLLGEVQTVIKPLGKVFQRLVGISGATILGSGDVAVILDVPQLVQIAADAQRGGSPAARSTASVIQ